MQMFLNALLKCSIVMSVISLAYMVAMPLLSKKYSAKWLYYIWLLVVVGWVFPFRPNLGTSFLHFKLPDAQVIQAKYMGLGEPFKIITNTTNEASSIQLWWIIASIWAFGTIGLLTHYVWKHGRFVKMVNRWSEDVRIQEILGVLNHLKKEMKINKHVMLKTCPFIASPMMIGFFCPTILLPCNKFDSDELTFILSHELIHLRRKDLWYKALILLAVAVNWFNPVVYIMAKAIAVQCEISCDELLVKKTSLEQRKQYGEALIGIVRNGVKLQTALSTNFYTDGNFIKTRLFCIMDATRKKTGITVLLVILIAIMGSSVTFASSPAMIGNGSFMTQNEQKIYGSTNRNKIINVDVKGAQGILDGFCNSGLRIRNRSI